MTPELVKITIDRIRPDVPSILKAQGIPDPQRVEPRTRSLAEAAQTLFSLSAAPVGVTVEISREEFALIYSGEGSNAAGNPLDEIIPEAVSFALFAVTVGEKVSQEITDLFAENDFAAGAMLDAAASVGADQAADAIERCREDRWSSSGLIDDRTAVMRFSPGYCGWHVSGQRKLFDRLRPEQIGIYLNDSYLMQPLKSVSGVIVAAPSEVFNIDDTYSFCSDCSTHSCRDRFSAILQKHQSYGYGK